MKALTRILAATDFSPAADRAVRRAALIAQQHGAELHLLHVVSPLNLYPGQDIDADLLDRAGLEAAGERLRPLAEVLAGHYGTRTHAVWRIGRAHTQIAEYARETAADLVVTGARGENTMLRLLLGSTVSRLLRIRRGPVLIARNLLTRPYERVLAAVDFSPDARIALDWARRLAGDSQIDVAHVLEPDFDHRLPPDERATANSEMRTIAQNLMANLLADLPGATTGHIETGHAPGRLLELAEAWHSDLAVVGRHGRGGLETLLLGSVSKDVAQAADCDVLVAGTE